MNCEKCQELLSDFLDGALSDEDHSTLGAHLEECLSCYQTHGELDSIVSFCREHRGEYDAPPNERALWLRIRNTLESQQQTGFRALAAKSPATTANAVGWLTRLFNRQWELSLPQMAASVAAIVLVVSFATAFGLRSMQPSASPATASGTNDLSPQAMSVTASYTGSIDDKLRQQQQLVEYWNRRVEQRKALWSAQTREAFERNLQVIDQAVAAYRDELQRNPHDEVSEEMLNTAMNEKMDLLREFSDL
ncbi:MAG: zf-HC2 domain-containing protein [Acidobacteria bacterium]|nr:zf-HC2 domain-containing protein [Acidobacteriota bacterium]